MRAEQLRRALGALEVVHGFPPSLPLIPEMPKPVSFRRCLPELWKVAESDAPLLALLQGASSHASYGGAPMYPPDNRGSKAAKDVYWKQWLEGGAWTSQTMSRFLKSHASSDPHDAHLVGANKAAQAEKREALGCRRVGKAAYIQLVMLWVWLRLQARHQWPELKASDAVYEYFVGQRLARRGKDLGRIWPDAPPFGIWKPWIRQIMKRRARELLRVDLQGADARRMKRSEAVGRELLARGLVHSAK